MVWASRAPLDPLQISVLHIARENCLGRLQTWGCLLPVDFCGDTTRGAFGEKSDLPFLFAVAKKIRQNADNRVSEMIHERNNRNRIQANLVVKHLVVQLCFLSVAFTDCFDMCKMSGVSSLHKLRAVRITW